jgi:transcriptional regulator with XRE-family HTH domain
MKRLSQQDLLKMLRREQGKMSLREFAKEIGISPAYLSDIYKGRRQGGKKLLDYFDLEKSISTEVQYRG